MSMQWSARCARDGHHRPTVHGQHVVASKSESDPLLPFSQVAVA